MAADWKKVAARRLEENRLLRARLAGTAAKAAALVRREVRLSLHAACVSISEPTVQRAIDRAAANVAAALTGHKEGSHG